MTSFDLNLLKPLQALLEEGNVSRAAARLQLSQPATSAALRRLRRYYDDDLLVRSGRSMELTPFARALLPAVVHGLTEIRNAVDLKNTFDPMHTDRRFVVAATDYMTAILAGPLLHTFANEAPHASVDFVPIAQVGHDLSCYSRLDAVVGPAEYRIPGNHELLFTDGFVVIADQSNPVFQTAALHMRLLEDVPHAVAYVINPEYTPAEKILDELGLQRRIAARLSGLASLPLLVTGTDMVALVPRMLARQATQTGRLITMEFPPNTEPKIVESIFWHPRDDSDLAITWLRDAVRRTVPLLFESFDPSSPSRVLRMETVNGDTL